MPGYVLVHWLKGNRQTIKNMADGRLDGFRDFFIGCIYYNVSNWKIWNK